MLPEFIEKNTFLGSLNNWFIWTFWWIIKIVFEIVYVVNLSPPIHNRGSASTRLSRNHLIGCRNNLHNCMYIGYFTWKDTHLFRHSQIPKRIASLLLSLKIIANMGNNCMRFGGIIKIDPSHLSTAYQTRMDKPPPTNKCVLDSRICTTI